MPAKAIAQGIRSLLEVIAERRHEEHHEGADHQHQRTPEPRHQPGQAVQAEHQVVEAVGVLGAGVELDHDFRQGQEDGDAQAEGDDGGQQLDRAVIDPRTWCSCG
jgi:hypothetical protein